MKTLTLTALLITIVLTGCVGGNNVGSTAPRPTPVVPSNLTPATTPVVPFESSNILTVESFATDYIRSNWNKEINTDFDESIAIYFPISKDVQHKTALSIDCRDTAVSQFDEDIKGITTLDCDYSNSEFCQNTYNPNGYDIYTVTYGKTYALIDSCEVTIGFYGDASQFKDEIDLLKSFTK